ncbi:hypothetical protein F5Y18DRAFT_438779 [Xylariaceae sp. FL1019]|nr:hypothetical protein F5Y18DRAFT_438779 [Xylariaceae sp. FL1019]
MSVPDEPITVNILPGVGDEWYHFDPVTQTLSAGGGLRKLDLSGFPICALPDNFERFQNLVEVNFNDCKFAFLPPQLGRCKNLLIIRMERNQMSWVPEESLPKGLERLGLANNRLCHFPRSIGLCTKLEICDLKGNYLSYLPADMAKCVNLKILCLDTNRFRVRHSWLREMPNLSHLDFSNNPCSRDLSDHPRRFGRTFTRDWVDTESNLTIPGYKVLLVMTTKNLPRSSLAGIEGRFSAYQHQSFQDMMGAPEFVHVQGTMCDPLNGFLEDPEISVVPNQVRTHFSLVGQIQRGEVWQLERLVSRKKGSMELRDILTVMVEVAKTSAYFHKNHCTFPRLTPERIFFHKGETVLLLDEMMVVRDYQRHTRWDKIEIRAMGDIVDELLDLAKYRKLHRVIRERIELLSCRMEDRDPEKRPSWIEVIETLELLRDLSYGGEKYSLRHKATRLVHRLRSTVKRYMTPSDDSRDEDLGE